MSARTLYTKTDSPYGPGGYPQEPFVPVADAEILAQPCVEREIALRLASQPLADSLYAETAPGVFHLADAAEVLGQSCVVEALAEKERLPIIQDYEDGRDAGDHARFARCKQDLVRAMGDRCNDGEADGFEWAALVEAVRALKASASEPPPAAPSGPPRTSR